MAFKVRFCRNCGTWIEEEVDFCPRCSEKLDVANYSNLYFSKISDEEKATLAYQNYGDLVNESSLNDSQREELALKNEKMQALASMLITSGFTFDGYTITKYSGYISGDDAIQVNRGTAVLGMATANTGDDLTDALVKIRRQALKELKEAAYNLGCNAVIGVDFDYITLEPETASISGKTTYLPYVFCVTANGNAVVIEKDEPAISVVDVLREYKQLLDEGIITREEFEAKKREFL